MNNKYYYEEIRYNKKNPIKICSIPVCEGRIEILEHWHRSVEINYMINAEAEYIVDGNYIRLRKGEVIIINSGSIHGVTPDLKTQTSKGTQAITISIPEAVFTEYIDDFNYIFFKVTDANNVDDITTILKKMADVDVSDAYKNIKMISLTYELVYILCTYYSTKKKNTENSNIKIIQDIIDYIRCMYKSDITAQSIAHEFSFSREHISRMFKRYTGTTIRDYIIKTKVCGAHDDMVDRDCSITEAAHNNGFSDSRSFINSFKKYYKMTPLQYKKHVTNK